MKATVEHVAGELNGLDRIAGELSSRWVRRVRDELTAQGRTAEGGWPGTTTEARQVVTELLRSDEGAPALRAMTREQRDRLARAVYDRAKKGWIAMVSSLRTLRKPS